MLVQKTRTIEQDPPDRQSAATISATLAEFALGVAMADIPAVVRERAKYLILNAVGIGFASGQHEFARTALDAFTGLGGGGVPVIGFPARLPGRDAAVMNGLLINGLDYDDTHQAAVMHATASVLPTVMSAAYDDRQSGASFLMAYVAGMEVAIRLGLVAGREFPVVGFHPTSVLGVFGCAAAAGRLASIDRNALVMAQGIALSMASGNLECHEEGAWSKRLHPGWAAQSAMTAVALAKAGFTGPSRPYEGRFGVFNSFLQRHKPTVEELAQATLSLGDKWHTEDVAVKPIPAVHWAHACSDAAVAIRKQHRFTLGDIKSINALVPAGVVQTVCEPLERKRRPQNAYAAQFSVPYIIAASLVAGRFTLRELEDDRLQDREILNLCDLVTYEVDAHTTYPVHFTGEVHIELRDGRRLTHREAINRGSRDRPLSNADIAGKFLENTRGALAPSIAMAIIDCVISLDSACNARQAIDIICNAGPRV